jgi:hypothetical protein
MTGNLSSPEYIGWRLVVFTALFVPLQIIAVALRIYARRLVIGPKLALDDALVILALIFQLIISAVGVGECLEPLKGTSMANQNRLATVPHAGVGYHLDYVKTNHPVKVITWGKYLVALTVIYAIGINIPKLAILVLYRNLFPMRTVRIVVWTLAGILVLQSISNIVALLAACQPFEANYNPTIPGAKCMDKELFFTWASIPNVVTDLAMLILPLPIVWGLHNTRRIKIALTFTFLVGSR